MESIQGLDRLIRRIGRLATDVRQVERPLRASGAVILASVEKNFKAQGRPNRWQSLSAGTLKRRRKGRGKGKGQILIDTARLKNSHSMRLTTEGVEVGTNVVYARRHHFGYAGGSGRGRSRTPARPFLMIQDEDIVSISEIFKRHLR